MRVLDALMGAHRREWQQRTKLLTEKQLPANHFSVVGCNRQLEALEYHMSLLVPKDLLKELNVKTRNF
jgi:hypothetical protein